MPRKGQIHSRCGLIVSIPSRRALSLEIYIAMTNKVPILFVPFDHLGKGSFDRKKASWFVAHMEERLDADALAQVPCRSHLLLSRPPNPLRSRCALLKAVQPSHHKQISTQRSHHKRILTVHALGRRCASSSPARAQP